MTPENKNAAPVEEAAKGVHQRENSIAPAQKISNLQLFGPDLIGNGFLVVPIRGGHKAPLGDGWQRARYTVDDLAKFQDLSLGVGVLCGQGEHPIVALDVDTFNPELVERFKAWAIEHLGATCERVGNAPRVLLPYRAEREGIRKKLSRAYQDNPPKQGKDGKPILHKLEALGFGQQFVAYHVHPDTGRPYYYTDLIGGLEAFKASELPIITQEQIAEAVQVFERMAEEVGLVTLDKAKEDKPAKDNTGPADLKVADFTETDMLKLEHAALGLSPSRLDDYQGWVDFGLAVASLKGTAFEDRAEALFHLVSAKSGLYDRDEALAKWSTFEPTSISYKSIFTWAKEDRPNAQNLDSSVDFVDFASLAHTAPPPREWIVQDWVPRRAVTALFGAGGHGKSLIAQQLAVAVANGRDWLGFPVQRGPVIGFFCEDDTDELLRRGAGLFSREEIRPEEGGRDLYLDARAGKANLMVTFTQDRYPVPSELMLQLRGLVKDLRPALVILDNIAQIYGGQENVRNEVTAFCNELTGLARAHNCAVLLIGHTAKAVESEFSGSTAWDAAVRSRLYIGRSEDGTTQFSRAKSNYSGLADMKLRYVGGAFEPIQEDSAFLADEASVEAVREDILRALGTLTRREVSTSASPTARNYLPKLMADDGTPRTYGKKEIAQVLNQMIERGEIEVGELPWKTSSRHPARGLRRAEK